MTSLHVIYGLALPHNPKSWLRLCIKPTLQRRKAAKYTLHCFQSKISSVYGSMGWNIEENFGMEWKIFSI